MYHSGSSPLRQSHSRWRSNRRLKFGRPASHRRKRFAPVNALMDGFCSARPKMLWCTIVEGLTLPDIHPNELMRYA